VTAEVWLGEDLATHKPAVEQLGHAAWFGQTQRAGKTTSLRTITYRAIRDLGASALVFRTGRADIPFPAAHVLTPFFRETIGWRSVERMLWTFLAEKPKVYRPIVMRAVHGAHTLEDVHRNFLAEAKRSKGGWVADRLHELDEYFREIIPWLRDHRHQRRSVNEACAEFRQRGWGEWKGGSGWNNMDRMLTKLACEGFLRNVDKGYVVVPEARARIRVKEE
jgi:hypothetical protein